MIWGLATPKKLLPSMKRFQLANHLQAQADRLHTEGMHMLYAVTAGSPNKGFADFLTDMFGSDKTLDQSKATTPAPTEEETETTDREYPF